jgi:hypothetical protein
MFRINGSTRQWNPFQPKSTASVGISGGHSAMGKMSLREAVSPTRKCRRSVTEQDVFDALTRSQQSIQLDGSKGKAPVSENRSPRAVQRLPRALFGSSSETAFETDNDGEEILSPKQYRSPLDEEMDPELAALRKLVNNTRDDPSLADRFEDAFYASQSASPQMLETGQVSQRDIRNENTSPSTGRLRFANPIASIPEASNAPLQEHNPLEEHKRTWKHKRSQAVDLTKSGVV